jgi:hypothetical protein
VNNLGHVHRKKWSRHEAVGSGVVWSNPEPNAAHKWERDPGSTRVHAYRVRGGRFTWLSFSYDAGSGRKLHVFRLRASALAWL